MKQAKVAVRCGPARVGRGLALEDVPGALSVTASGEPDMRVSVTKCALTRSELLSVAIKHPTAAWYSTAQRRRCQVGTGEHAADQDL